jgi:hypothetical protein
MARRTPNPVTYTESYKASNGTSVAPGEFISFMKSQGARKVHDGEDRSDPNVSQRKIQFNYGSSRVEYWQGQGEMKPYAEIIVTSHDEAELDRLCSSLEEMFGLGKN